MSINKNDYTIVAKQLVKELLDKITGENEEWLFGKVPSEVVMVGRIDGGVQETSILDNFETQGSECVPSIGLRFRINNNEEQIRIKILGKLFYRIRPTYEQQCTYMINEYNKTSEVKVEKIEDLQQLITNKKLEKDYIEPMQDIVNIYKSISLEKMGVFTIQMKSFEDSIVDVNQEIKNRLEQLIDSIKLDSVCIKNTKRKISELMDSSKCKLAIDALTNTAIPNWDIQLFSSIDGNSEYSEIVLQLANNTNKMNFQGSFDTPIFNVVIEVECDNDFIPIEFNGLKHYYLDNPNIPGVGNNCTVVKLSDKKIKTENTPIYEQQRVITIDKFNEFIEFDALINNPEDNLSKILTKMEDKLEEYNSELELVKKFESKKYIEGFSDEIINFSFEVKRFKAGIELIKNRTYVKKAFLLMNKTFLQNKKYNGWRLFQIVFIVSELSDMVYCEFNNTPGYQCNDIDNVDLIYFPTGGGKTETFLGCAIFAGFFDRLRGKEGGVTAIIKYPLRLLAAQQLDRILQLTINANIIKNNENINGDDFTVGFFTGSQNTPNKITEEKCKEIISSSQESINSLHRQIDICPICKSEINVEFDQINWTLKHICANEKCKFNPPIYIVDNEVYRYTPTFIVSTIDKMASIGLNMGFKSIFGQSELYCPNHGYILSGKKCNVPDCKCAAELSMEIKDPVPTLLIQDELHLINQSLGTFDSHYESLIEYYCANLISKSQRKKIKYIGATATISNYRKHIRNLYGKDAKKFPTSIKKENFYSIEDKNDISRIIIGTALCGGSITDRIQKMITELRIIIWNWRKKSSAKINELNNIGFVGSENDLNDILQYYLITIVYNNSKNDAGKVSSILQNQGANALIAEGIDNFEIAEITGDIEFKTIKSVMHQIEASIDKYKTKNVIVATSAISHGVDEDFFNQIFFFGMPNQTSEYIQAYSRVGRKYTGLVFDIFRIVRDRDKSYMKNFNNFHEYKDLLIDQVPINRYAKNAVYSTLPGIISSLLLQHYVKSWRAIDVTKSINDGYLKLEKMIEDINNIYECDRQDSKLYKEIIDREVEMIFNAFSSNSDSQITITEFLKKSSTMKKGPMTSLRDVDVALEIELRGND